MPNFSTIMRALDGPSIWIVISLFAFFLWKASAWKTNVENKLSNVENGLSNIEKVVEKLSKKVDALYNIIMEKYGRSVDQASSPVTLSDYGKDIAGRIDVEKIVSVYADKLHRETKNMNAYQIQEHCFDFCNNKLVKDLEKKNKEFFEKLSEVAFADGVDIEKITRVVGIKLRDRVLEMKDIVHAEVDQHSPSPGES